MGMSDSHSLTMERPPTLSNAATSAHSEFGFFDPAVTSLGLQRGEQQKGPHKDFIFICISTLMIM